MEVVGNAEMIFQPFPSSSKCWYLTLSALHDKAEIELKKSIDRSDTYKTVGKI